jgi:hypothetical protein
MQSGGMIALVVEVSGIEGQQMVWAGLDTQPAPLATFFINLESSLVHRRAISNPIAITQTGYG